MPQLQINEIVRECKVSITSLSPVSGSVLILVWPWALTVVSTSGSDDIFENFQSDLRL